MIQASITYCANVSGALFQLLKEFLTFIFFIISFYFYVFHGGAIFDRRLFLFLGFHGIYIFQTPVSHAGFSRYFCFLQCFMDRFYNDFSCSWFSVIFLIFYCFWHPNLSTSFFKYTFKGILMQI